MVTKQRWSVMTIVAILVASGLTVLAPPAGAAGRTVVTMSVSSQQVRRGEMVWFSGKVTAGGKAATGRSLALQRRSGSTWTTVATSTTSSKGTFSIRQRPAAEHTYRVLAKAAGVASARRSIEITGGKRGLWQRADILGSRLGTAKGSTASATVKGTKSVRYRSFTKGMLVQVTKASGTQRSWLVYGDILTAYRKRGGPTGWLGVPLADPKCGLLESGCVQRFTGGAIYDNKNKAAVVVRGTGRKVEIIAAAKSQVGYQQTSYNNSKYNKWAGRTGAWCSVFQSWAAAASGNTWVIPQHARWASFLADVRKNEKLGSTPRVGALVFYDTILDGKTAATHVGLVVEVRSKTIVTIEGNTSTPGASDGRGVYQKERPRSMPLYYAYPRY
ncbi:CHAP domain-containing protein [Cellulomonas sp. PhB150]|uniref:CHAP domain-containing protein n=1 Tax=Cellulomonas sp. PhB150 TaxID=2485188 RepID=UPI000F487B03|nr:CHAP domain-containing protein [Cellulomonas sp. PhB150]ROS31225.1 LGFP repeat-containing protein [Cellulomonas sp. PhB150]